MTATKNLTPKSPADVNLADVTIDGLSYPDAKKADRRRGFCACCGRSGFMLNKDGRLSRHGFERPRYWGVTIGECRGSGMKPQDTIVLAIEQIERSIPKAEALLAGDMVEFTIRATQNEFRQAYLRELESDSYWARRKGREPRVRRGTSHRNDNARIMRVLRSFRATGVPTDYPKFGKVESAVYRVQRQRSNIERELAALRSALATLQDLQVRITAAASGVGASETTDCRLRFEDYAGYRSQRRHCLGGSLVVVDAAAQGLDEEDGRWVVLWERSPWQDEEMFAPISPSFRTLRAATEFADIEASGIKDWHWGCGWSDGSRGL